MKSIIVILCCIILVSCDPESAFTECSYQYPINAIGLNDTIKTTDTIWIENDLDATLCLNEGIYKNGKGEEIPTFKKLIKDSLHWYSPTIINFSDSNRDQNNYLFYRIKMIYDNGRYNSKYGIIFPESGIYAVSNFGCALANGKDGSVSIQGYFNVNSNNMNLFSANVKVPTPEIGQPNKYFVYFFEVID